MGSVYRSGVGEMAVSVEKRDRDRFEVSAGARHLSVTARLLAPTTLRLEGNDGPRTAHVVRQGDTVQVFLGGAVYRFDTAAEDDSAPTHVLQTPRITAPMPGKVLRVLVREGQQVGRGDGLIILEAMKMENRIVADADATIAHVAVAEGQTVDAGALLIELDLAT